MQPLLEVVVRTERLADLLGQGFCGEARLELGLELVELVEVAHAPESSSAKRASTGPFPGTSRAGSSSASGSRTNRRSCSLGWGNCSCGSAGPLFPEGGG